MDAAGNRTQFVEKDQQGNGIGTTSATYSDDNRLLTYGNLAYDWDDNGNLTGKTVNQVETTYGWDYENKLTSLEDGSTLSFTYNGDGLRQSRTVDGTTTRYVYSGMRLLQETNSGGTTQVDYTLAPIGGEWEPLVSQRKSGASRWYAFDVLGTTRALTDGSEDVAAVFTDDAYGNVLNASDSMATAHQYVGRYGYYLDSASGLQLLTQRYYDSAVGRFATGDPARAGGNWYAYVDGRPGLAADPLGLDKVCIPYMLDLTVGIWGVSVGATYCRERFECCGDSADCKSVTATASAGLSLDVHSILTSWMDQSKWDAESAAILGVLSGTLFGLPGPDVVEPTYAETCPKPGSHFHWQFCFTGCAVAWSFSICWGTDWEGNVHGWPPIIDYGWDWCGAPFLGFTLDLGKAWCQ
jgi:RHS repeat-associated protein